MLKHQLPLLVLAATLSACSGDDEPAPAPDLNAPPDTSSMSPPRFSPDSPGTWLGRWNGPEGTYLAITREGAEFYLEIANLDGPQTYQAEPFGDELQFRRDGAVETIRVTDGAGTGMKWLADKRLCLTVHRGEGYCRD
jgi:hypothetical protein